MIVMDKKSTVKPDPGSTTIGGKRKVADSS